MNQLYRKIMDVLHEKAGFVGKSEFKITDEMSEKVFVIPPARTRYLSEISENNRIYDKNSKQQTEVAQKLYGVYKTLVTISELEENTDTLLNKNGLEEETFLNVGKEKKESDPAKLQIIELLLKEFSRIKMEDRKSTRLNSSHV